METDIDDSRQGVLLDSVLGAIGKTPLVELSRITRGLEGHILAKLEYLNPGFSKKDRIALQMIEEAEEDGNLTPGQTVVELTSGNTGTGLAIVCAVKGYPWNETRSGQINFVCREVHGLTTCIRPVRF